MIAYSHVFQRWSPFTPQHIPGDGPLVQCHNSLTFMPRPYGHMRGYGRMHDALWRMS